MFAEPVVILVGDGYAGAMDGVSLTDFSGERWISTREGTAGSLALERACANLGSLHASAAEPTIATSCGASCGQVSASLPQRRNNPSIEDMIWALSAAAASVSAAW